MAIKRVLVIDDSATERHIIGEILGKQGYEVSFAEDGEKGIAESKASRPDLIIMDVVMPGANGFQATRAITMGVKTKHIPVVMLSSKDQTADKVWALRQGAVNYLVKPVQEKELIATVGHLLGKEANNA